MQVQREPVQEREKEHPVSFACAYVIGVVIMWAYMLARIWIAGVEEEDNGNV